jgi:hypothetical protein
MHGYGEFYWKDGKIYVGYYVNDKKEGFGIYYWSNPGRAYLGFWVNGRQEGVGKYITPKGSKFGHWDKGERVKWYKSESEAMNEMKVENLKFVPLFKYNLENIMSFLEI